jgi:hypothetical protein
MQDRNQTWFGCWTARFSIWGPSWRGDGQRSLSINTSAQSGTRRHQSAAQKQAPLSHFRDSHMSESTSKRSPSSDDQLLPNQKMRTTCNACQQAKIRCSHTHPCERCESHGYQCIYSISQPLGRPAKKKTARLAAGVQTRKGEGEAVDRWSRRCAKRGTTRPTPTAREQRVRKVLDRMPSPSTTIIGADPIGREEFHRSDSGTGTEVLPVDEDSQWPSFTELISDVSGGQIIIPQIIEAINDH